jgi:hypothetical protein
MYRGTRVNQPGDAIVTANPSYFRALLAEAINASQGAWQLQTQALPLTAVAERLYGHGQSTPDVTLDGDVL